MTWSIVAKDPATDQIGIAVSTCAFAVGARVPFIETGTGAIASQAFVNPFYGLRGMALLRAGATAQQALDILTSRDEGRSQRQAHIQDKAGGIAAYTGADCVPWCGHLVRDTFSVAGNMLAGPEVIAETARLYEARSDLPFAKRLIAALQAGEAAGGDKRGKQSAALLIHDCEEYALFDLRVDDHAEPLTELERLERVAHQRYLHYRKVMPRRDDPAGVIDRDEIERRIVQSIAAEAQA
ncbi:MAG: DUF1028 domain-containing protein [Beijerinckiaceae bacterium]|nr:DUF1028 domain-containing protein [Beijerinckiaceae bacterium]MCZ8300022.1 DUF1028 domain-containing protein [Beijerinckiaceae bacterium]